MAENDQSDLNVKTDTAHLLYVVLIANVFTLTLSGWIGMIWAYLERRSTKSKLLHSHYTFLIHTFWKGLLIFIFGVVTSFFVVGLLILLIWFVWTLVRLIKGWRALFRRQPIENPRRWGF